MPFKSTFQEMAEPGMFVSKVIMVDGTYMVTGFAKTIPNGKTIEIQFIAEH